jgi:signal transduction histidine kinase
VELEVHDEGVGIPEPELARVFERFWRGGADDRRPAGLGLGLAVARAFVEACGGQLEAESGGHGRGARFRMRLPIASDPGSLEVEQ